MNTFSDAKRDLRGHLRHILAFLRWIVFSILVGIVAGAVSTAFYYSFHWAVTTRSAHPWLLWLLPVGGVAIALLYRVFKMEKDQGTNFVLTAVRDNTSLSLRTAPLVFISTIITHLFGGSSGREGAILQIGGSISFGIGRLLRLDDKDSRIITMCGMAAAFSALFGTPLTAAIFAMEVVSVGVMYYAAIVPCTVSSLVGLSVAKLLGVPATAFSLQGIPAVTTLTLFRSLIMGVLLALLAIIFCRVMHNTHRLYTRFLPNQPARIIVGGLLVIVLTYLVWIWNPGTYDYNNAGEEIIHAAISGQTRPEAFLWKILFTAVTLGAGYKGGEIVPVLFTGATFGCTAAPLLGLHPSFGAGLGMVGLFCGVTNCPLSSLLLALELFGASDGFSVQSLALFAVCIAVSYMLSGYSGLYGEQKIMYSKHRLEYINRKANEKERP